MAGFLLLLAVVNIFIGVLNMIPLLPLDGGHAAIATYERIRSIGGRRYIADVSRSCRSPTRSFMVLVLVGVSSIYLDIVDPINLESEQPWTSASRPFPRRDDPADHGRHGARRRRRPDHGAVDDDHQDGRRRGHAPADLRARRRRVRHRALHLQRDRGGRGPGPDRAPLARADHRRHPPPVPAWPWPRSRPACTACASTPATSASPSTSRSWPQECKDRGIPIRIGVNGGSLDPTLYEKYGGRVTPGGDGRVRRAGAAPTSTRSASTTSRSRSRRRTCRS